MNKLVTRINWVNDTSPALDEDNLNQMDSELNALDDRLISVNAKADTVISSAQTALEGATEQAGIATAKATAAAGSATSASTSSTTATNKALVSEGYANGTQNGTEVGESSPYYHNNARYWKEEAKAIAGGGVTSFNGRSGSVTPQSGDYSLDMISGGEQIDTNLAELQILGWKVPKECPIQNSISDGNLIQKVGRVNLGSLDWDYNSGFSAFRTMDITDSKAHSTSALELQYTSKGYTSVGRMTVNQIDKSITINSIFHTENTTYIKDTSYTTVEAFTASLKGQYLYYELASEKTYNIPNSIGIAEDCDNLQFVGYTIPKEMPIHNYKDSDGNFHKRVGRVRLADCTWAKLGSENSYYTTLSNFGFDTSKTTVKANLYCTEFTTTSQAGRTENSISAFDQGSNTILVSKTTYTTADTFKSHLDSVNAYLYYELATEEVIKCGGEKINTLSDTYKTKAESANVVISSTAPSDTTALWVVP